MRHVKRIVGAAAVLLVLFLVVGYLLPGRWSVERSHRIAAEPAEIFPYLNTVALWDAWTPWAEVEAEPVGPPAGVGAGREWNDPRYGQGSFRITGSDPDREVRYRVSVEEGSAVIRGRIRLDPEPQGTVVRWTEEGDFGGNPLLGWTALFVGDDQGRALEESLRRLDEALGNARDDGGDGSAETAERRI